MNPLTFDEIEMVSGGNLEQWYYDQQVSTFLWQMELSGGGRGTSSEQPTPPAWWGDPESERWREYVRNHYG